MPRPDIAAIRARWETTTPGEWGHNKGMLHAGWVGDVFQGDLLGMQPRGPMHDSEPAFRRDDDVDFVVKAHNSDIPALLAYIDELERRLAETSAKP